GVSFFYKHIVPTELKNPNGFRNPATDLEMSEVQQTQCVGRVEFTTPDKCQKAHLALIWTRLVYVGCRCALPDLRKM
ncbi:MAG: hypothetical protein OXU23_13720, partial [Candidatus Poribacteria bacterium]|nr:hypothetical protein [Candidatus Poribacteria bacterium]